MSQTSCREVDGLCFHGALQPCPTTTPRGSHACIRGHSRTALVRKANSLLVVTVGDESPDVKMCPLQAYRRHGGRLMAG
jgi:hypothetical protein